MAVKLKDVAEHAGVGYGTASRALANGSKVSVQARDRVLRSAQILGYRRNTVAGLLGARRKASEKKLKVSFIGEAGPTERLIKNRCHLSGLQYDHIHPERFSQPHSLLRTLKNRGTDGLIVDFRNLPWTEASAKEADWSGFAVLKFGRIFPSLPFDLIRHSAFDYMRTALFHIRAAGARRIAVLLSESGVPEDDDARQAALLLARERWRSMGIRIFSREWQAEKMKIADKDCLEWLRTQNPDVILGLSWALLFPLLEAGWRIPEETGFVSILLSSTAQQHSPLPLVSGCQTQEKEMVRRAVGLLLDKLGRGDLGFPESQVEHVVEPAWFEGNTLR